MSMVGYIPDAARAYVLWVTESDADSVRFEADRLANPDDELYLDFGHGGLVSERIALPQVGDEVSVQGTPDCGYLRLTDSSGELLFEGGNPSCLPQSVGDLWEPPVLLGMRPAPEPNLCRDECGSGVAYQVTLGIDGREEVVPLGDAREFAIDGRTFLAQTLYARYEDHGCGLVDGDGIRGTAYVGALRE